MIETLPLFSSLCLVQQLKKKMKKEETLWFVAPNLLVLFHLRCPNLFIEIHKKRKEKEISIAFILLCIHFSWFFVCCCYWLK